MECLILVLVDKSCDNARLVVQTQKSVNLLDIHSMEMNKYSEEHSLPYASSDRTFAGNTCVYTRIQDWSKL